MQGGLPLFYLNDQQTFLDVSFGFDDAYLVRHPNETSWVVPFQTRSAGVANILISAQNNGEMLRVRNTLVNFAVDAFVSPYYLNSSHAQTTVGSPTTTMGDGIINIATTGYYTRLRFVPGVSPTWYYLLQNTSYTVGVSDDNFETMRLAIYENVILRGNEQCTSVYPSVSGGVKDMMRLSEAYLFNTYNGLVTASLNADQNVTEWKNVLAACIWKMQFSSQHSAYISGFSNYVLAFGYSAATVYGSFVTTPGSTNPVVFEELKDAGTGKTLYETFSSDTSAPLAASARVLAGSGAIVSPEVFVLLVDSGNTNPEYILYHYVRENKKKDYDYEAQLPYAGNLQYYLSDITSPNKKDLYTVQPHFARTFVFPQTVLGSSSTQSSRIRLFQKDSVTVNSNTSIHRIGNTGSPQVTLVLRGMAHAESSQEALFLWGNMLLFSPDNGQSMYILQAFTSSYVNTFSSTSGGNFVVRTDNNEVWYGQVGNSYLRKIQSSSDIGASMMDVFFDPTGLLTTLTVSTGVTTLNYTSSLALSGTAQASVDVGEVIDGYVCPVSTVEARGPLDASYTRYSSLDKKVVVDNMHLPYHIFLDYEQSYEFFVLITPYPGIGIENVALGTSIEPGVVSVTTSRATTNAGGSWEYKFTVTDLGVFREKSTSGNNLTMVNLVISIRNGTLSCQNDARIGAITSQSSLSLQIFSGCPPDYELLFSEQESIEGDQGCFRDHGVPCVYFDNTFSPYFGLFDEVTNREVRYRENVQFRIIGGGLTYETIVSYNETEQDKYNAGGSAPIWELELPRDSSDTYLDVDHDTILWLCSPGSPCSGVLPYFALTPQYYFKILIETGEVNEDSYCNLSQVFYLRVHGIPMDLPMTLFTTFGTVIILLIVGIIPFFWWSWRHGGPLAGIWWYEKLRSALFARRIEMSEILETEGETMSHEDGFEMDVLNSTLETPFADGIHDIFSASPSPVKRGPEATTSRKL